MLEAFDHYYRVTYGRDHGQYYKELEPYFDVLKRYADGETNYETVMKAYEKFRVLSEQVENSDDSNLHQIRFYDNFSRLFEYLGVGAEPVCFLIMDRNMERDTVKEYERMLKTERQWQLQKLREYFPDITIYVKLK
jgi:hypothetical protein